MSGVINLRRARKAKARDEHAAAAAENRAAHGQSKAVRSLTEARSALERARLDAHLLTPRADADAKDA